MKLQIAGTALALTLLSATSAMAGQVLYDNFDQDTTMLNWTTGDGIFVPVPSTPVQGTPSVDLIGGTNYGSLCGGPSTNNCIDLDGSTGSGNNPAGEIQSATTFAAGHYTLSFTLGGNDRGNVAQTTDISLGSWSATPITLASSVPQTIYNFSFTTTGGKLDFKELGPSDQQGNILDNISLSAVPEPATWSMLLIGFFGLGAVARMGRRSGALPVA